MILFNDRGDGYAIAKVAECLFNPTVDVVISRHENDSLLGGVIFNDYTKRTICVHVAGFDKHWMNRDLLWVVFDYAFEQLGCEAILSEIKQSNKEALDFNIKIGFTPLVIVPEVYPDGDLIVTRMRRSECRWLGLKPRSLRRNFDGQEGLSSAAA